MATAEQVATAYQRRQQQISTAATRAAVAVFGRLDEHALSESWAAGVGPSVTAVVERAQLAAAEEAAPYLAVLAAAQGVNASRLLGATIVARSLAGIASDGRPLTSLLFLPVLLIKRLLGDGMKLREALAQGRHMVALLAATQVADAGRAAVTVGMVGDRTWTSYVRVVHLPACSRCIVLAGREYAWSTGFLRHPRCDCTMALRVHRSDGTEDGPQPLSPSSLFQQMTPAEQDKAFGKAGAESIRLGANPGQVVNARRGMQTAGGRLVTTTGTTTRGTAGRRMGAKASRKAAVRPMPEQILRDANGDRDLAIDLLRRFGYLI
jgi:hypothetical protein